MTTRAARRKRVHMAQSQPLHRVEQRYHYTWPVQIAARMRYLVGQRIAWRMIRAAGRLVRVDERVDGGPWRRTGYRIQITPQTGEVHLVATPVQHEPDGSLHSI